MRENVILIIGTADTKAQELALLESEIHGLGAAAMIMDVGVIGSPGIRPDIDHHQVAAAAGTTTGTLARSRENEGMAAMAAGAVVGAAAANSGQVEFERPVVELSSLGTSGLAYGPDSSRCSRREATRWSSSTPSGSAAVCSNTSPRRAGWPRRWTSA